MPYLQVDVEIETRVRVAARAAHVPEGEFGWGLLQLWLYMWREDFTRIHVAALSGFFGHHDTALTAAEALEAFGFGVISEDRVWIDVSIPPVVSLKARRTEAVPVVYFVQSKSGGPIKIGFTTNLGRRLTGLQTGSHEPYVVLATIENGTETLERELHERFVRSRISGEWFQPTPDLLAFIETKKEG